MTERPSVDVMMGVLLDGHRLRRQFNATAKPILCPRGRHVRGYIVDTERGQFVLLKQEDPTVGGVWGLAEWLDDAPDEVAMSCPGCSRAHVWVLDVALLRDA
jgi:hypothetical protein